MSLTLLEDAHKICILLFICNYYKKLSKYSNNIKTLVESKIKTIKILQSQISVKRLQPLQNSSNNAFKYLKVQILSAISQFWFRAKSKLK